MGTKTGFHHSTSAQYLLHIKNKIPKRGRKHIVAFAILVHYFNIKNKSPYWGRKRKVVDVISTPFFSDIKIKSPNGDENFFSHPITTKVILYKKQIPLMGTN